MTLAMLATLIFLGTWQVNRLFWKQALLADIAAAERNPPLPLGPSPPPFARVRADGVFDAIAALYGAELRTVGGIPTGGARLLGILRRDGAPPVLVDRGWVPVPPPPVAAGPASIEGYIRPPDSAGTFAPADDLAGRRFFTLDPAAIGRALGVPDLAPYTLVALGPAGLPDPARSLPRPPNNHLAYVITWYGLAVALVAVFIVYLRKVRRP
jgi:surfeit locus 1 family protein